MDGRAKGKLLLALRALVSPVASFCLRHGLKIQDLERVLKVALLDVAERDLRSRGEAVNASKLSAATGIARKFVPQHLSDSELLETSSDLITRIVGQWQGDSRFQTPNGAPRSLSVEGVESDFNKLVKSVTLDLNSYTVLAELTRLSLIEKKGGKVTLQSKINLVKKLPDAMALVAADLEVLRNAAEENVNSVEPKHLHLTTRYDNLPASAIPRIQAWLLKEGSEFHRRAREFLSNFDRDISPTKSNNLEGRYQVHLGAFSYTENFADGSANSTQTGVDEEK